MPRSREAWVTRCSSTLSRNISEKTSQSTILHLDFFDYVKSVPGATIRKFDLNKMETDFISVTGRIICDTDYLIGQNKNIFSELTKTYYTSAISAIKESIGGKDLTLYVFSDDIIWASEMISHTKEKYVMMPYREAYQDLFLMTQSKHHIIANSTFSWWGAALGIHKKGLTVAPSCWFKKKSNPDQYLTVGS